MSKEFISVLLACYSMASLVAGQDVRLVSVSSAGEQGDDNCFGEMSRTGDVVLIRSQAMNLIRDDQNGSAQDVFTHDRLTAETVVESVNSSGQQANAMSFFGWLSPTGKFVAFETTASNMGMPNNNVNQVYLRDRVAQATEHISKTVSGLPGTSASFTGFVTPDGRFVTFLSYSLNLTAQPYTPPQYFIRDRQTGETFIASILPNGNPSNQFPDMGDLSDDGRFVCFIGKLPGVLPQIFVRDRQRGVTTLITEAVGGGYSNFEESYVPLMSGDGRYVFFTSGASNLVENDTNGKLDAFLHDLHLGKTTRISVSEDGQQLAGDSYNGFISSNGRFVTFSSYAAGVVAQDTNGFADSFVLDRWTGQLELITLSWQNTQLNNHAFVAGISDDGRVVAISTNATNVISDPVNGFWALYVRERWKLGDVNRDGIVNVVDLLAIINAWGPCPAAPPPPALPIPCDADVTNDNTVNVADLLLIINNWG